MPHVAHELPGDRPPTRIRSLFRAIEAEDEVLVGRVIALSRRHPALAPLALTTGAFAMLLHGLRLLVSNWRLMLIQAFPALWLWLAMADLKVHVLQGNSFHLLRGAALLPVGLALVALTAVAFFLDAVFAFSIARGRHPRISLGFADARRHLTPILGSGLVLGVLLALSTTVVTRWGHPWFALSLGIVVGAMMVAYVAVPARLLGVRPTHSKRDKLAASVLTGTLSLAICTPPYLLARLGILLLGSVLIPGVVLLVVGATLHAGTTAAVSAIKLSASLTATGDRGTVRAKPRAGHR
jgi:hypothetical protein